MANPTTSDLIVTALNALAASSTGTMTLADFSAHLETRHGSTEPEAQDARSPQSRQFQDVVQDLLSGPGGLAESGYATLDETGGRIQITPAGRTFIGR